MADLYVMQNEHGLIKIGQSVEPQYRRGRIAWTDRAHVEIVAILPAQGWHEERVHSALREHALAGEWFNGDERARTSILKCLKLPADTRWPFDLNPATAEEWYRYLLTRRDERKLARDFDREIQILADANEPHQVHDYCIWGLVFQQELESGLHFRWGVQVDGIRALPIYRGDHPTGDYVPSYTRDVGSALSLWPDDDRPGEVGRIGAPVLRGRAESAAEAHSRATLFLRQALRGRASAARVSVAGHGRSRQREYRRPSLAIAGGKGRPAV